MNSPIHSNEWELLSAYLDGQLTESDQRRVRELLGRSAELQEGLEELRRTRAVLRAAPRRRVPHNFTLTPAMVQKPRPRFSWNWAPALGVASALATILLVLTFFLKFSPAVSSTASLPAAAPQVAQNQTDGLRGAPPIIIWNSVPAGMGGGGLGGGPAPETAPQGAPSAPVPYAGQGAATPAPEATPAPARPGFAATVPAASDTAAPTANTPKTAGVQPTATQAESARSAAQAAPLSGTTDKSGPILGVASTEERGKMVVPTLSQPDDYQVHAAETPADSNMRTFQWILAAIAVLTGLVAAALWWRTRH